MTHHDFASRIDGEAVRFIANGDKGGIFSKDGSVRRVTVVEQPKGLGAPKVVDEAGNPVELKRIPRPCSCTGGVWKTTLADLEAKL